MPMLGVYQFFMKLFSSPDATEEETRKEIKANQNEERYNSTDGSQESGSNRNGGLRNK
jgi:hypothetical protein